MKTVLVTGARGRVGSQVVAALCDRGDVHVRSAVRELEGYEPTARVTPVRFDFSDLISVSVALHEVDAIFLITPLSQRERDCVRVLVDAAREVGVPRIVRLSMLGAEIEHGSRLQRLHRAAEQYIERCGISATLLRPNFLMERFLWSFQPEGDDCIHLPLSEAPISWVAARDVGEVAAKTLVEPGHEGRAYTLTGPEALTAAQALDIFNEVTGRALRYQSVTPEHFCDEMIAAGRPRWEAEALAELYAPGGEVGHVTPTVEELLGRPATSLRDWARGYVLPETRSS